MKQKSLSLIALMLSLAGCGGGSGTSSPETATSGSAVMLAVSTSGTRLLATVDSSEFLMTAYLDGLSEIQLAQLALQNSSNSDVRNFAQRMVDDHGQMNNEIQQLAQSRNISLPTDLSAEQKAQADRIATLSGEQFDHAYMAVNVGTHEADVAAAKLQAAQGTDTDVRMFAATNLPILDVHLAVAKENYFLLEPVAFVIGAYQDGLMEIQMSQLAVQKALDSEVRNFAQRMIDDHTQANARIAALAQQTGIALPTGLTPDQQAAIDDISRFSGVDFDKTYMDKNVVSHVKALRLASQQSGQGRDPNVRTLARLNLPGLAEHLLRAIDIDRRIEPEFLYAAYQAGTTEIQMAHLVSIRGTNNDVKAFAQQMISEQATINAQIMQLAQQRNLPLPSEMPPEQLRSFVRLLTESGQASDADYMDITVKNLRKDLADLMDQSQLATDSDIRTIAQNALPVVTAQLTRARALMQQLTTPVSP